MIGLWRFKFFARRTTSDKVLHDKIFNIAENRKCEGYQRKLASMVSKYLDEKSSHENSDEST